MFSELEDLGGYVVGVCHGAPAVGFIKAAAETVSTVIVGFLPEVSSSGVLQLCNRAL